MLLKYFYDHKLAQASYMVGCAENGEALVIDPARDITPYLQAARAENLRIAHVTETHIHADFVSGARELASATGAHLYLCGEGGADWQYAFADENTTLLHDGDSWMVGNICIEVIHTPGHTPEHIVFQVTDTKNADKPIGLFTGDFLFVGDVGRPDLLEEAAGIAGTREEGARGQFHNVQRFKTMPDYLQIWPGHGAGSACGKALGAIPSTTLGYEKLFNPAFQIDDENAFVNWLLEGQPEAPRYFAEMKRVNKAGAALLHNLPQPQRLETFILNDVLKNAALVIDTRGLDDYAAAHIRGTLNIPASSSSFNTYAGWFVDYNAPLYLIVPDTNIDEVMRDLRAIGVDNIAGYFVASDVLSRNPDLTSLTAIEPAELAQQKSEHEVLVLDVRGKSEVEEFRIPGTRHIPYGLLRRHLDELPRETPIVTQCASGMRSQIAASYLRQQGFNNVTHLKGGIDAWKAAGLPIEK
jgi:hydroxyacylglutathione hydrolase